MRALPCLLATLAGSALLSAAPDAFAEGRQINLYQADAKTISINGVIKEWGNPFTSLSNTLKGSASGVAMDVSLAYDEQWIYVAGEVTDKQFVRTPAFGENEDHAELLLTFPDDSGQYRTTYELQLYAGVPGKSAGQIKARGLGVVATAQIVEMRTGDGYDFEAKIPWSLFPPAARTRTGIRGAALYHNATGGSISGVIGTVDKTSPAASLPWIPIACEQSLINGLMRDRGLSGPPSQDFHADVFGDAMKERVMLFDHWLVVLGAHYRGGSAYYYGNLDVDVAAGQLPLFEVRDVTGDSKSELVMRLRHGRGNGWREMLAVKGFDKDGNPQSILEHETGISSPIGTIQNDVRVAPSARGASIRIALGSHSGYNSANFREPTETDRDPMLLPWGEIKSKTFEWDGKQFKQTAQEKKEPGDDASAPAGPPSPPAPRAPTADEMLDQVFALYKSERKLDPRALPKFDFVTNVAEDERMERILGHDRDLVVFGQGFKEGRGYVYVTLSQFTDAKDVVDVTARDMNGDGLADILVRGVQRTQAPEELGTGEFHREVLFIYTVSPQSISRVFGVETALALGDKRIQGSLSLLAGQSGLDIELRPGRSVGWDRSSWPYKQDTEAVSGIEPLLLPWTTKPVRYRFASDHYTR